MGSFSGFDEASVRSGVVIPEEFLSRFLAQIDRLIDLKLFLYLFWKLSQMEGAFRYLRRSQLFRDRDLLSVLSYDDTETVDEVGAALERLIESGLFLAADVELGAGADTLYFLHNARGRAAVAAIEAGEWRLTGDPDAPVSIDSERPNIYRLYEENIGPLSPMIAEALKDAEDSYPLIWIEKAIQLAVTNNARSWRYVEAILDRWQREGPDERENRRDTEKDRRRYLQWENPD